MIESWPRGIAEINGSIFRNELFFFDLNAAQELNSSLSHVLLNLLSMLRTVHIHDPHINSLP